MIWAVLAFAIVSNASANILIKAGMKARNLEGDVVGALFNALLSPFMIGGIVMFILALLGYSYVLSRMNLSVAYPVMTTVGFVLVLSASWLLFHEAITPVQVIGYALMLSGVWLVVR